LPLIRYADNAAMKPVLETDRLFLRELTLDDVDNLLRIFSDPEAMRYYPATKDCPSALEFRIRH
jgi:RimJ/RimL family protein N-acetyltransferase